MNTLIGIVLVLGVIILVHEWGHFIIARMFGVRVDVFSIGFGPRLFGWKRGATDWRISALPLILLGVLYGVVGLPESRILKQPLAVSYLSTSLAQPSPLRPGDRIVDL